MGKSLDLKDSPNSCWLYPTIYICIVIFVCIYTVYIYTYVPPICIPVICFNAIGCWILVVRREAKAKAKSMSRKPLRGAAKAKSAVKKTGTKQCFRGWGQSFEYVFAGTLYAFLTTMFI